MLEQYKEEAKARWGKTDAWKEYEKKEEAGGDFQSAGERMMALFAELGGLRQLAPDAPQVQEKIAALRQFITDHYYTCTPEILRGLGQMYVGDERFCKNIDKAGGEGTAQFARAAIEAYCARQ